MVIAQIAKALGMKIPRAADPTWDLEYMEGLYEEIEGAEHVFFGVGELTGSKPVYLRVECVGDSLKQRIQQLILVHSDSVSVKEFNADGNETIQIDHNELVLRNIQAVAETKGPRDIPALSEDAHKCDGADLIGVWELDKAATMKMHKQMLEEWGLGIITRDRKEARWWIDNCVPLKVIWSEIEYKFSVRGYVYDSVVVKAYFNDAGIIKVQVEEGRIARILPVKLLSKKKYSHYGYIYRRIDA